MTRPVDPAVKLAVARHIVSQRTPQLAGYAHLPTLVDDRLNPPTACVTDDGTIRWHPDILAEESVQGLAFIHVHEILHPLLGHTDPSRMPNLDPQTRNEAYDCVVNPLVRAMGYTPPKTPAIWPKDYGFEEGWTAEQYGEAIHAQKKLKTPQPPHAGSGACAGQCGSGAGNPTQGEPPKGQNGPLPPAAGQTPNAAQQALGNANAVDDRRLQEVAAQTAEAIARNPGSLPGDLVREVAGRFKVKEPSWDSVLERAARKAMRSTVAGRDRTYTRPNRMQAALGYGEGVPVLATHVRNDPVIVLIVDTSGSVFHSDEQMGQILGAADDLLGRIGGKSVVLAVDTRVRSSLKARDVVGLRKKLKGGGGTDFRSALAEIDAGKHGKACLVAVFTDGFAQVPVATKTPVIWALVPGGVVPAKYGEVIRIAEKT